jgi:hypothetical protein
MTGFGDRITLLAISLKVALALETVNLFMEISHIRDQAELKA